MAPVLPGHLLAEHLLNRSEPTLVVEAATLSSDQLLVVGGFDGSNHLDSTEVLDVWATVFGSSACLEVISCELR